METTMTRIRTLALAATLTLGLASCSLLGGDQETDAPTAPAPTGTSSDAGGTSGDAQQATATGAPAPTTPDEVVLVAHDSFTVPEELVVQFEADTGFELEIQLAGGEVALAGVGATALFASAHFLDMMYQVSHW